MIRRLIRRFFPEFFRLGLRRLIRFTGDLPLSLRGRFARRGNISESAFSAVLTIEQKIMPSGYLAQKIHNLNLAARLVYGVVVEPGAIFSFWRAIGRPDKAANFLASRTIRDGRVEAEEGGGLCQVAGMLYEAALRCSFEITERFSHSMDIYEEEERFTPLGLDAAVVFGYKDLRFVNTSVTDVTFCLRISGNVIQLQVLGRRPDEIRLHKLKPQRFADSGNMRRAAVHILGAGSRVEKIIESQYRIPVKE